jgi:DNA-binding MarR family transcriptional regulator
MSVSAAAGLKGDPPVFMALTEIAIIAQLAEKLFESVLPDGLTNAQYGVLNHLLRLNAEQSIGELASAFQVRQPTMSSTVRKLEDKGLIEFKPDAGDRRIKRVAVTAAGAAARRNGVDAIAPILARFITMMPADEIEAMLPTLTKLRALFDTNRPE